MLIEHFFVDDKYIQIVKFGRVKYKCDFPVIYGKEMHYRNPRIEYVDNKWILTMSVEFESQEHTLNTTPLGIDVGVKTMITAAYGNECISFANINKTKKMRYLQKRVKHLHRDLSRKYEQSKQGKAYVVTNNIRKTKNKLRKAYKRISDIRRNYIHQCTRKLINLYPSKIVIEDLNIDPMRKNRCLAKAVSDACLSTILYQIRYKAEFNNIPIILADRFYRSSKLCSKCGNIKYDLKLSDRIYRCESCGLVIDRDFNAALNLQKYTA